MRIATGGIVHETSTFTTVPTTINSADERDGCQRGSALFDKYRGANWSIGGFMEGAEAHGFELIPTFYWVAHPAGPLPRGDFDALVGELFEAIAAAGNIDGVLLDVHGSMVAEAVPDADGHLLAAVRQLVGPEIPIVAQLDIHSNVSSTMVEMADVLIGRETFPEIDMAERGRECADVLARILRNGVRPNMALSQIPMLWGVNQVTAHPPMREAIDYLHEIESRPDIICGSIAVGYGLADVPDMGASVYVVADGDQDLAQACADELSSWIFDRRADWHSETPSTADAIKAVDAAGGYPAIFADTCDNTGGGSPGDSTGMLRAFVDAGLEDACLLYIVDAEVVKECHEAGVGASLELKVGAKSTELQGKPVLMRAEVLAVSDGKFRYDGPMYGGLEGNMGPSAHIRQDGVHVLLVSAREQPFCTAFSTTMELEPQQMRYIGVKSSAHFRAGFEAWAGAISVVAEPSVHNPAGAKLAFKNLGRQLYPFDKI